MKLYIIHYKCTARSKTIFVYTSHTVPKLYITLCTAMSTAVFSKVHCTLYWNTQS